ncbi:cupin domain-containing protein [Christensenellaceae bacterium OttesenSCG-928-K19]|nr:cupin domain-containing protein [Christensenellaceae bacterium OttesenSCG-928-K19]
MIKRAFKKDNAANLCDGKGTAVMEHWLVGEELSPNFTQYCTVTLEPGASIGDHVHTGEAEVYHIISGTGDYSDNGTVEKVGPGDVMICYAGESHGVVNTGTEDLAFLTVIVTS